MQRNILLNTIVKEAGIAIRSLPKNQSFQNKTGEDNFVSDGDKLSEKIIIDAIHKFFPEDTILSEETQNALSSDQLFNAQNLWIIDPIDGTTDYLFNLAHCCVSIAYAEHGILRLSALYNPYTETLYTAESGSGAYLNNVKIHCSTLSEFTHAKVTTTNAYTSNERKKHIEILLQFPHTPWSFIRGSAALSFAEVASGQTDFCYSFSLKPWDIAASLLLLQESGATYIETSGQTANFLSSSLIAGNHNLVNFFHTEILKKEI